MKTNLLNQARARTFLANLLFLAIAATSMAVMTQPFSGWGNLKKKSPDIIIVRCTKTPSRLSVNSGGLVLEIKGGVIRSDVEVISVLKGTTNVGPVLLKSTCWPRQGELYLVFSIRQDNVCQAIESYRIVPLGIDFSTNMLAGQSCDQQIKMLLQYRLDHLNRQLQEEQEEKKRLEQVNN